MVLERDKAELLLVALLVLHLCAVLDWDWEGRAELGGQLLDLWLVPLAWHIFDENICKLFCTVAILTDALVSRFETANVNLGLAQKSDRGYKKLTFFSFNNFPLTFSMAFCAASSVSKWTKPYPLDSGWSNSFSGLLTQTLHDKMLPKAENVS